jgi:hypothetical protein
MTRGMYRGRAERLAKRDFGKPAINLWRDADVDIVDLINRAPADDPYPIVFLREELGGPTEVGREQLRHDWFKRACRRADRERREREAAKVAAPRCAICGEGVLEQWLHRSPRHLTTCSTCSGAVPVKYPDVRVHGLKPGHPDGLSPDLSWTLRACTIALWWLEHPKAIPGEDQNAWRRRYR